MAPSHQGLTSQCLTLVMPAYNEQSTILESVERVLAQSFVAELIIVNDASTDGTTQLIEQLTDPRVHVLTHETNQGKGAAMQRVNAARKLFPSMWFSEKCQAGLDALGWYHEKKDEKRDIGLGPNHDWSSHGADAFGLAAVAYEPPSSTEINVGWVAPPAY